MTCQGRVLCLCTEGNGDRSQKWTECGCLRKEGESLGSVWPLGEQGALTPATWFLGVTGRRQSRGEIEGHFQGSTGPGNSHRPVAGAVANTVSSTSQGQAPCLTPSVLSLTLRRWQAASCPFPKAGSRGREGRRLA